MDKLLTADEVAARLGFKVKNVGLLLKYADYNAKAFGADKSILWLQAEVAF